MEQLYVPLSITYHFTLLTLVIDFYNKYHIIFMSAFVIFGLIECFLGFMSIKVRLHCFIVNIYSIVDFLCGWISSWFFHYFIDLLLAHFQWNSVFPPPATLIYYPYSSNMKYLILAVEICVGLLIGCLMVSVLSIGKFMFGMSLLSFLPLL